MHCRIAGCSRTTTGYSALCAKHFRRKRRNGDAQQRRITRADLQPHIDLVRSFIARRGDDLWGRLESLLGAAVRDARGIVAEAQSGRPFHRPTAAAASEFIRVADTAPPRTIVEVVVATAVMTHRDPHAFKSDDAARVQTCRLFRFLSRATKRRYTGQDLKPRSVTTELRLDVAVALGRMLMEALGAVGLRIAEAAEREHQARAEAYQAAYSAIQAQPL